MPRVEALLVQHPERPLLLTTLAPIEQLLREGRCTESARAAPARTTSAGH
ncbi:MAG: hypothetical protein ACYCYN_05535 [Solirubrobacteraceae bacterium]